MASRARDWPAVRAEYIAGVEAVDLARKYGIPLATLQSRASREKWGDERKQVASHVQVELPAAVAEIVVGQAADVARQNLEDLDAYRRELVGLLPSIREKGGPIGAGGWIENYRKLQDAQRLALGQPTTNDAPTPKPTKGGDPHAASDPEADSNASAPAPAAVLLLPGKSTDWRELAEARESGLDP